MIKLENVHKAMNNANVQEVVNSLMFHWTFEEEVEENLGEWIASVSKMFRFDPSLDEQLAIKTLFHIRIENAMEKGEWSIN